MDTIQSALTKVGVPPHLAGFDYLQSAVKMVLQDRALLRGITTKLYPSIASKHNTTPSSVNLAIRHAVESAFDRMSTETVSSVFGTSVMATKGKVTNAEFIATIAMHLE